MTLRILIADDSESVSRAITALLLADSKEWLVCGVAADGEQAIARATETLPDIILLDLSLPQTPGNSLATRLREAVPAATIVIMSALEARVLRQFADLLGVEYFLPKSELGTELIAILNRIAGKQRNS
jgi:DNA-binding NarL/FixJ family response regulator